MNAFDIVTIIIISFCLIQGLFKGLIREISAIVGVLAGFYGSYTYYYLLTPFLERWIANEGYRSILCFFLLFCMIVVLISLVAMMIRYLLNIVFLGWVDRLCGMVFGAVKGFIIISILLISCTTFLPGNSKLIETSRLAPHMAMVSDMMSAFVSVDMRKELQIKLEGIRRIWEKNTAVQKRV